jgi:hypothetical protein
MVAMALVARGCMGVHLHVFEGALLLTQHVRPAIDIDAHFLSHVVPHRRDLLATLTNLTARLLIESQDSMSSSKHSPVLS